PPTPLRIINLETEISEDESRRQTNMNRAWVHLGFALMLCIIFVLLFCTASLFVKEMVGPDSLDNITKLREIYLQRERERRLGGRITLSPLEEVANARLLAVKQVDEEEHRLWQSYHNRPPPFLGHRNISDTDLYALLRSMPKGGLLHVHDSGILGTDLLIQMTQRDNLWVCVNLDQGFEDFRFSLFYPDILPSDDYQCSWMLMRDFYEHEPLAKFVARLKESLSVPQEGFGTSRELARHLKRSQRLIHGLITYKPLWSNFLFGMLQDLYADGVQYVEMRSSLPILYDMEGSDYTILDSAEAMVTVSNLFQSTYKDFIGIKLIYAPSRDFNDSRMDSYVANAQLLKKHFPQLLAGFDLVSHGNECELPPLSRISQLSKLFKKVDFYFHAGDSRCQDSIQPDVNLIDAMLLGSKRIGNSLNVPLHSEVMRGLHFLNVAVEVCPLSNHYLEYVNDFRNHPAAYLIAAGFPIVIGSDYPYFWNASPLTDDFYVAFVGMVGGNGNLRLLKQLAKNSLLHSALNGLEKTRAMDKWKCNWNRWIKNFLNSTQY
ncbi:hypothetical protein KR059_006287, partial [Drosophila kikkawai]